MKVKSSRDRKETAQVAFLSERMKYLLKHHPIYKWWKEIAPEFIPSDLKQIIDLFGLKYDLLSLCLAANETEIFELLITSGVAISKKLIDIIKQPQYIAFQRCIEYYNYLFPLLPKKLKYIKSIPQIDPEQAIKKFQLDGHYFNDPIKILRYSEEELAKSLDPSKIKWYHDKHEQEIKALALLPEVDYNYVNPKLQEYIKKHSLEVQFIYGLSSLVPEAITSDTLKSQFEHLSSHHKHTVDLLYLTNEYLQVVLEKAPSMMPVLESYMVPFINKKLAASRSCTMVEDLCEMLGSSQLHFDIDKIIEPIPHMIWGPIRLSPKTKPAKYIKPYNFILRLPDNISCQAKFPHFAKFLTTLSSGQLNRLANNIAREAVSNNAHTIHLINHGKALCIKMLTFDQNFIDEMFDQVLQMFLNRNIGHNWNFYTLYVLISKVTSISQEQMAKYAFNIAS